MEFRGHVRNTINFLGSGYFVRVPELLRLSQWERLVVTLLLTALMPMALHALPITSPSGLGQMWLPIFYAPLIAALCFRPHVAILAGLCGPSINNFIFGMPADGLVLSLTFTLVVFSAAILLLRRRVQPSGGMVALAYTGAFFFARFIFAQGTFVELVHGALRSVAIALPGIVVLAVVAEIVRHFHQRQDA